MQESAFDNRHIGPGKIQSINGPKVLINMKNHEDF